MFSINNNKVLYWIHPFQRGVYSHLYVCMVLLVGTILLVIYYKEFQLPHLIDFRFSWTLHSETVFSNIMQSTWVAHKITTNTKKFAWYFCAHIRVKFILRIERDVYEIIAYRDIIWHSRAENIVVVYPNQLLGCWF